MRLTIVSGLSGSGKSVALNMLEDLAFYCIDNVPATLLDSLVSKIIATQDSLYNSLAVGLDARNRMTDLESLPDLIRSLQKQGVYCEIIFLHADTDILLKRYRETRRVHPLRSEGIDLRNALELERELLGPVTYSADLVIDTTQTSISELRELIRSRVGDNERPGLSILVESFGYKHGLPVDADFVFDLRCLPNPYWDLALRPLTGKNQKVIEYLESYDSVQKMYTDILGFLQRRIPEYAESNRNYLTIGIGCTGGQHRSVYMVDKIVRSLSKDKNHVLARHSEVLTSNDAAANNPTTT